MDIFKNFYSTFIFAQDHMFENGIRIYIVLFENLELYVNLT